MRRIALAMLAFLALSAGARAGILVVSSGTLTTSVVAPPVVLEIGPAGATTRYFSPLVLSANATFVTGTVLGRAGADWSAQDVLRLVNQRSSGQAVTLSVASMSNAQVELLTWTVYNGSTRVATLDARTPSPSVSFTLPGSATYRIDLRLDLADGAGLHNAPASIDLALRIGNGGIRVTQTTSAPALSIATVEVPIRPLIAGSSGGTNSTNGTATVNAPTAIINTQNAFYLNNTNASAVWYVKLVNTATGSISDVLTANIGINNGTSSIDQVKVASGVLTQTGSSYQRLEPGSTGRIYVTSLEGALWNGATFNLDVYASDSVSGASFLISKARITLV